MEKRISPVVFVSNRHAFRRGEQCLERGPGRSRGAPNHTCTAPRDPHPSESGCCHRIRTLSHSVGAWVACGRWRCIRPPARAGLLCTPVPPMYCSRNSSAHSFRQSSLLQEHNCSRAPGLQIRHSLLDNSYVCRRRRPRSPRSSHRHSRMPTAHRNDSWRSVGTWFLLAWVDV